MDGKIQSFLSSSNSFAYCYIYSHYFDEFLKFNTQHFKLNSDSNPQFMGFMNDHHKEPYKSVTYDIKGNALFNISVPIRYKTDHSKSYELPDFLTLHDPFESSEDSEEIIGYLYLGIQFQEVYQSLAKTKQFFLFISVIIVLLALIFYYYQNKSLTGKLYALIQYSRTVKNTSLENLPSIVPSKDEIGFLALNFQTMLRNVFTYQSQLKDKNMELEETNLQLDEAVKKIQNFNRGLEAKIKERTLQLAKLNETLQIKNHDLAKANETKERFLSMMSHELRTPLNAILGFSQLALKKIQDPLFRDFFSEIRNNGEHLLGLINDLLDFTKLESGRLELICANFDTVKLIHEVAAATSSLIDPVKIKILLPQSTEIFMAYGDWIRIKQILINFASNASKFTAKGTIEFRIQKTTSSIAESFRIDPKYFNRTCLLSVKDSGIGIPYEYLDTIFERFKQVDTSETRIRGTGLGLSISKNLAQLHHTDVVISSMEGIGTEIGCLIPLTKEDFNYLESINKPADEN